MLADAGRVARSDYGKAVMDEHGVNHVASQTPYRALCGAEWLALTFSWETRLLLHCRRCIDAIDAAAKREHEEGHRA